MWSSNVVPELGFLQTGVPEEPEDIPKYNITETVLQDEGMTFDDESQWRVETSCRSKPRIVTQIKKSMTIPQETKPPIEEKSAGLQRCMRSGLHSQSRVKTGAQSRDKVSLSMSSTKGTVVSCIRIKGCAPIVSCVFAALCK